MKKTLIAVALSAAVASVSAADVSVYGVMDMGVSVSKKSGATGDNRWRLQMKSGMRNSSRFGLKGKEDLGNNYKVPREQLSLLQIPYPLLYLFLTDLLYHDLLLL